MLAHARLHAAARGGTLATTRTHTRHLARGKLTCRASAKHMLLHANTHVYLIRPPPTHKPARPRARTVARVHTRTLAHTHTQRGTRDDRTTSLLYHPPAETKLW